MLDGLRDFAVEERVTSTVSRPSVPRWGAWILYGLLPALAFAATWWLYRHVFHGAPITTDENSYVFQAYNFLAGLIARPAPPFPDIVYHAMIICDDRAGWLSRYPPDCRL